MDVNGSRFHFINTAAEWHGWLGKSNGNEIVWDEKRQGIALQAEAYRYPRPPSENDLEPAQHRGAAYDRFGVVYWIGEERQSLRFANPGLATAPSAIYWSLQDWRQQCAQQAQSKDGAFHSCHGPNESGLLNATRLSGLAVSCAHYLLVGTYYPGGVLIFDLHAGGKPMWLLWPDEMNFMPRDLCVNDDGHIVILDTAARLWRLDNHFRVLGQQTAAQQTAISIFQPAAPASRPDALSCLALPGVSSDLAVETGLNGARAIEHLPDGSLLVLETPDSESESSSLHRFVNGSRRQSITLQVLKDADSDHMAALRGHDLVFLAAKDVLAGAVSGLLYVCDSSGKQSHAFELEVLAAEMQLKFIADFYPMHAYTGVALAAHDGGVYYNMQQRWLPLARKPLQRFADEGYIDNIILDSEETACLWNRIILDACIPDDTELKIRTRSADKREWLVTEDFDDEPAPYYRRYGSELAGQLPRRSDKAHEKNGSWELLLQNATGRYLEICVQFKGNGRGSPLLRAMRVYYPRFSYLKEYLPAVYQDDALSASFLDRYLANVEGLFTEYEERIAHIEFLFDARSTPGEFLPWLAGWLGIVFDSQWDDARRRLFLRFAPLLYRWRGTLEGLRAMIALTIAPCLHDDLFAALKTLSSNEPASMPDRDTKANTYAFTDAIHIVEHFQMRSYSALALGNTDNQDIAVQLDMQQWSAEQDVESLHDSYRTFLESVLDEQKRTDLAAADYRFPPTIPQNEALAQAWHNFLQQGLAFPYAEIDACNPVDGQRFQVFLQRRYGQINKLNKAYGLGADTAISAFQKIPLPALLPAGKQQLADWLWFVSVVMPVKRNAHRFSVLVPAYVDEKPAQRQLRLQKTQQLVQQEKPAHTDFEVKLYWSLFRAGSARLGIDSILGEGSRYTAMVLDHEYLTQSYLAPSHPFNIKERLVCGRDRLQEV